MDFKQIEAFVNVVKYGSFSKAADASFLTQPTISSHISTLEKELGQKLINRNGKKALPTKQGEMLYKYAISMLKTRERAMLSLESYTQDIGGVLEIQSSSIPAGYIVPKLMGEFREIHPNMKFYMEQSDSSIVESNLLDQKGEIGFLGYRSSVPSLNCEKIMTDTVVLITPNNDKFQKFIGKTISPKDFIDEPFIWREQGSATRKEFEAAVNAIGYDSKRLNIVVRANSMEAIKQSVSNGLGVSVVSKIVVDQSLDSAGFLSFSIEGMEYGREFYLVWNKSTFLSPAAEAFKNFVLNRK